MLLQPTNQEVALLRSEIKSREEIGGEKWEGEVEIGKDGVDIVENKEEELFNVGYTGWPLFFMKKSQYISVHYAYTKVR